MKIRKYDWTNFWDDFISLLKNSTDQDYFFSILDTFKWQHPSEFESLLNELWVPQEVRNDNAVMSIVSGTTHRDIKPIIFTEWKTDVVILKMAWLKLNGIDFDESNLNEIFDQNSMFRIKSADLREWQYIEPFSNAEVLGKILYYWKWDSPVMWLFDRDDTWFKWLHLLDTSTKVFKEVEDDGDVLKVKEINGKPFVFGFTYPVPVNRTWYEIFDRRIGSCSIEIEHYFNDNDLVRYIWEKNSIVTMKEWDFVWSKIIIGKKGNMIKRIFKNKDKIDFSNFSVLFEKIENYISFM